MEPYISLYADHLSPKALHDLLSTELLDAPDVRLEVRQFRSPETAILVAIVGAVGTGLGALIAGILKVAAHKGTAKVVLQGRSGRRVEVPADCPSDKIEEYVRLAKELDVGRIEL